MPNGDTRKTTAASKNDERICIVGSVNLDMTVRVSRLPQPGETVTNGVLSRYPGGKGANQALAARRLGAEVSLVACVGDDAAADEALALLKEDGVDLSQVAVDPEAATGIAMIAVDDAGENQIVVAPGANRRLRSENLELPEARAVICQLEVPVKTLLRAAKDYAGFFCINLAPIMEVPDELIERADLLVVNEVEAAHYGETLARAGGLVALTYGRRGAVLKKGGEFLAEETPPRVRAVDTTGAGDTFTAALVVALMEGRAPAAALAFACAAAAASTEKPGAQPALPRREEVERLLEASRGRAAG